MQRKTQQNKALQSFFDFWSKYAPIDAAHRDWARQHFEVLTAKRNELLYDISVPQRTIYFVCQGMLAFVMIDERTHKRMILKVALANDALKTTQHLYSNTPKLGSLIALRRSVVLRIRLSVVRELREREPLVARLVNMIINRNNQQLYTQLSVILPKSPLTRYFLFRKKLKALHAAMTQQEQADFLGVSRRSIQKSQAIFLKTT